MKTILTCLLILLSLNVYSSLKLDVNYVRKKQVDEKLTLSTEVHQSVDLMSGEEVSITLKDGLSLSLSSSLKDNFKSMGPLPLFSLKGRLYQSVGGTKHFLGDIDDSVEMGERVEVSFKDNMGHKIDMAITPTLR